MMLTIQTKKARVRRLLFFLACFFLLTAFIYQQISNKQDTLSLLQQGEPAVTRYEELDGAYKTYGLYDQADHLLNYGVIASASGYGGPITMLTVVDQEGTIANAVLIEDSETPLYLKKVLEEGYPEIFQGKTVTQLLSTYEDIDGVSGATRTADGIMLAVEKGMFQVGMNQLGLTVPTLKVFYVQWQDGLLVFLMLFVILAAARNMKKFRPWILVAAVLVLGFMENTSLTIGNYMSILALKMPAFFERPIWYVMVIGVLIITLLWGRNFYCSWLCPFGAVQEGAYKALNLANYHPNPKLISGARKSRWFFLWMAAMLALLFNNPGIASYEPFSVFFDGDGNTSQWIMMLLILLFSIFVLRFWCRYFCPVGAFLDFIATCKRTAQKLCRRKLGSDNSVPEKEEIQLGRQGFMAEEMVKLNGRFEGVAEPACAACSGCQREKEISRLSSGDKLVAGAIILIGMLIMGALLQSIGL